MLLRLTELRVPPWSARTKLHAPSRPAPCGAGQDMARRPPSSQKIGRLLQHPPSPLSTRSRNRVRYKVGCLRVPMRDVCGTMRGAWGTGGAPVSSGLVRRLGLRVCPVYRSCCLLPAALVPVPSERAVRRSPRSPSVVAWCARPPFTGSARVASVPIVRPCAAPCT